MTRSPMNMTSSVGKGSLLDDIFRRLGNVENISVAKRSLKLNLTYIEEIKYITSTSIMDDKRGFIMRTEILNELSSRLISVFAV